MAPRTGSRLRTVAAVLRQVVGETRSAPPSDAPDDRERRRARAVRGALESLGPFYVKIGQMLSTRPDMVSPIMIEELQNLHDEVDVQPFSELEPVLERNLGPDWKRHFDDIDVERPLGAASLAQVHQVTLADGRPGVIKVQRPGIRDTVLTDMALLRKAARLIARAAPRFSAVVDVEAMLGGVFDAMEPELDFTKEAANMDRAREALRGFERLSVPSVLAATEGVLVQSMAPGVSVRKADPAALRDRDRLAVSRELIAFMYRSYFIERVYHADPHAGNVFVTGDGEATLIDWGMIGRIDQRTSMRLLLVLMAVAQNDGHGLAKAWVEMGRTTPWSDIPGFSQDMAALVPKVATASLEELNFGITLTSVLEKSTRRGIASCPAVSLLGKSFANLEGSVRCLAPELALVDVFQREVPRIVLHMVREAGSPQASARRLLEATLTQAGASEQLRALNDDIADRALRVQFSEVVPTRSQGGRSGPHAALALGALALYLDHRRRKA
ncbi:ATP/GTP-binding protein [Streptomyces davaonensis JCM 4913]|uniref:ATP/GTP-binding protein n=1 Tax=Streptomyces davaonensis (strain DSM 101723 / JCM 4913 / KCC S-0913 / 768) TaxID=1214101 RepID=K4R4B9_STRDJ|nr:AarF/UbiB family protein [Streptomyces davaonensis]CCK27544.1 ATP/GTP-binding protein [Streptomyces davaonensis JCM 4913]